MTDVNDRVAKVARDIIDTIKDRMAAHQVSHEEYRKAWAWLVELADSGEVPLFLDVFFESAVERITYDGLPGSEGAVQGPYHLPDQARLQRPYKLPMRADEEGTPFVFSGRVNDLDGTPIAGAVVDVWHAGNDGTYSGFNPAAPAGNLRGVVETADDGAFELATVRPAPYPIPAAGPTGAFLEMTGGHVMRPAHFHFILTKPGYDALITQLYFRGDPVIEGPGDCVDGVKESLIIDVGEGDDPEVRDRYGIDAPSYQTGSYTWQLRAGA